VFSMIPDLSKTASDFAHVGVYSVGSSPHSDVYSMMRPLTDKETEYMQKSVEEIYDSFVGLVANGRGLTREFVDSVAQGRVWAGTDALKLGLVDEIGSLKDAVKYAASFCGDPTLANWNVKAYPGPMSPMEEFMSMFGMSDEEYKTIKAALRGKDFTPKGQFEYLRAAFKDWNLSSGERFYARMPYEIVIK